MKMLHNYLKVLNLIHTINIHTVKIKGIRVQLLTDLFKLNLSKELLKNFTVAKDFIVGSLALFHVDDAEFKVHGTLLFLK